MADLAVGPEQETSKPDMPAMSFLEHLEELRRRIISALIAIAAGFAICWYFAERIFGYMQTPIMAALARNGLEQKLVYLNPTEPFNLYLKIGLVAGIFLACPVVLYQVWAFIAPGLYRHERRYIIPFMVFAVGLFLAGGYFGYRIVFPAALDFLIEYGKAFTPQITIKEYTDLFMTVVLGLGVVFEMPILVLFLSMMGVITAGFMWRNIRYAILGIFVIAAILTPTTDVMNMAIFAGPMIGLYILSIGLAWLVSPARRKPKPAQA